MKTIQKYEVEDGTLFDSAEEALAYEQWLPLSINLSEYFYDENSDRYEVCLTSFRQFVLTNQVAVQMMIESEADVDEDEVLLEALEDLWNKRT